MNGSTWRISLNNRFRNSSGSMSHDNHMMITCRSHDSPFSSLLAPFILPSSSNSLRNFIMDSCLASPYLFKTRQTSYTSQSGII